MLNKTSESESESGTKSIVTYALIVLRSHAE